MKKTLKAAAAVILILVMCMSLTGCIQIDKMREKQGYMTKDGAIMLGGSKYLPLPYCEELCPEFGYDSDDRIYLTDEDVPVLLSGFVGESCDISKDKVFINAYLYYDLEYGYYCREDKYDEILNAINNGYQADGYKYFYYDYSDEFDFTEGYVKERIFTDEEIEAINTVLSGATCDEIDKYYADYNMYTEIYSYTDGLPFERYEFDILTYSNRYFIMVPNYVLSEDYEDVEDNWYMVPEELVPIFENLMKEQQLEYEYYYGKYDDSIYCY